MAPSKTTPIFTGIEFYPDQEDDVQSMITQPLMEDDLSVVNQKKPSKSLPEDGVGAIARFVSLGVLTGFFIQVVSLGAYTFLLTHYGGDSADSEGDWLVYGMLSLFTQVDLVIYIMIWVAFTCTMTRNGMSFIRGTFHSLITRRSVFVLGVRFLVGVVLGAFAAWSLIDVYLGFPIPFVPIATTVAIDLLLCYFMVWCYDLGKEGTEDEEEHAACC